MTTGQSQGGGSRGEHFAVGERIGAIDIGTNTVLLTVAERVGSGGDLTDQLKVVAEHHAITRLGQGVDQRQRLDAEASQRTLDCLERYRQELRQLGTNYTVCVGTSALRDAAEGAVFVARASALLGCPVEIVSGAREAELTFRGAVSCLEPAPHSVATDGTDDDLILAFDIGGGSTELVLGTRRGQVKWANSIDVGSVRLFERHGDETFERARDAVRTLLPEPIGDAPSLVLGIAGTMTTLWTLQYGLPFDETSAADRPLDKEAIARFAIDLHRMPVEARRQQLHIDEGRADVIPFGALVAAEVLRWLGKSEVRVTARGVRYGLLLETFA